MDPMLNYSEWVRAGHRMALWTSKRRGPKIEDLEWCAL